MDKEVQKTYKRRSKEVHEQFTFLPYIYKVLKELHPELGIRREAINELNLLLHNLAERLLNESIHLAKRKKKKTISDWDIETGVLICLPSQLANVAVQEGKEAVTQIENSNPGLDAKRKKVSRQSRAGLMFSVGRIEALIRHQRSIERVGASAPVYLAAVLEYITADILQIAGDYAKDYKKTRISPRQLAMMIHIDENFEKLFRGVTLSGGVIPHILPALLKVKKRKPTRKSLGF